MQLIFVANMDADEVLRSLANVNATTDVQHVLSAVRRMSINGVTTARKTTDVQTATAGDMSVPRSQ